MGKVCLSTSGSAAACIAAIGDTPEAAEFVRLMRRLGLFYFRGEERHTLFYSKAYWRKAVRRAPWGMFFLCLL